MITDNQIRDMVRLLKDYERWQADLVLSDKTWDTPTGLPMLTQEQNDRLIELQLRRNAILNGIPVEYSLDEAK